VSDSVQKKYRMLDHEDWSFIANPRVFDMELYIKDKGSEYRDPKEFFLNVEYEHVEAIAQFFNDLAADLKKHGKIQ